MRKMSETLGSRAGGRGRLAGLLLVAGALVAIFVSSFFFSFSVRRPPSAPAVEEEPEVATRPPRPASLPAVAGAPDPSEGEAAVAGAPIIDEIEVEKQEVCEGEENLITIKAHTPVGRDDAFLHYAIGGTPGRSIAVRAVLPTEGLDSPGPVRVQVFGRGDALTSAEVPPYKVKKCRPDRVLLLNARAMPNSSDQFELGAVVREGGPSAPLRVSAYRWSFGDGGSTVTAEPAVVHRFAPRDPDALVSDFVVACEAVSGDGRSVVGRTTLSLRNREFENLEFQKTLVLSVELTPRFPELDGDGRVVQRVRLYHHRSAPVRLERATLSFRSGRGAEPPPDEVRPVGELLGTEEVPPGPGVEAAFRLDTKARPDVLMVDYFFEGHTTDGVKASGTFSIMVPPPRPTPDTGARVVDELLTRKILRARERLGRPFVNDEDLRQLERAGVFADLGAPPAEPPPAVVEEVAPPAAASEAARAAKRSVIR